MHILRAFAARGAPTRRVRDWTGRWWGLWGAVDLVPIGNLVIVANPHLLNPFWMRRKSRSPAAIPAGSSLATGFASHGEAVRRTRNKAGTVTDIWLAGGNLKPEKAMAAEMERRYAPRKRRPSLISADLAALYFISACSLGRGTPGARRRANRTCGRPDRPRA